MGGTRLLSGKILRGGNGDPLTMVERSNKLSSKTEGFVLIDSRERIVIIIRGCYWFLV